jgi:hypothetical protein
MRMYDKDAGLKGIKGAPFLPPDPTHFYCAVLDWLHFSYICVPQDILLLSTCPI